MRIAYVMLAHKSPFQVARLVERLRMPGARFYLHVDARTDARVFREFENALRPMPDVMFLRRHRSDWGRIGLVTATLEGIRAAVAESNFDVLSLVTGQDYPIKSNGYIAEFFERNEGRSFLEYFRLPGREWQDERGGLDRIEYWHVHLRRVAVRLPPQRLHRFIKRRLPPGIAAFGGSAYWSLNEEAVRYVHEFVTDNPEFIRYLRHAKIPEELFMQMILLSSPLADSIVNDNLRYIDWSANEAHPAVLTRSDFTTLASSTALYARKFDVDRDSEIMDLIDATLLRTA